MAYQHRLKPWPAWAAAEYRTLLTSAHRLCLEAKVGLHQVKQGDVLSLRKSLLRLVQQAREAELAALRVERGREERRERRWPRWAIYALRLVIDGSRIVTYQVETAVLEPRNWVEIERRLHHCLAAGQQMELALRSGPPPAGETVSGYTEKGL